jgi:hypothetical protein
MANIDDIKERIKSESARLWERIQGSSAFNQLKDRYENLTPFVQKLLVIGIILVTCGILVSIPLTSYMSGNDSIANYEDQRDLIHDLFKIQQDMQTTSGLTPAPSADALASRIDADLHGSTLLPEQIRGVTVDSVPNTLPKTHIDGALRVALNKLNLRQIVDIGHQIMSINPAIKMLDLSIEANMQDPKYFDVVYKFISLKIPVYVPPASDEENPGKGKKPAKPKVPKENEE